MAVDVLCVDDNQPPSGTPRICEGISEKPKEFDLILLIPNKILDVEDTVRKYCKSNKSFGLY